MSYEFLAPARIVFGWGKRREAGRLARSLGQRALLVLGSQSLIKSGVIAQLVDDLADAGVASLHLADIRREPLVEDVDRAVAGAKTSFAAGDFVLAIGGGSALDLGKAVAALVTQPAEASVRDYLEGVGRGLTLQQAPLPVMALPTTAGTGSEATRNAVVSSFDPPFKKSLRHEQLMPRTVLVDPELTASLPRDVTAWTGLDAVTQLIESYITRRRQPLAQAIALHGLELAGTAFPAVLRDGACQWGREAMSHAALCSGWALANSGLGLAHGVAAALGSHARIAHGLACAVMLPVALRVNREKCESELARVGAALTGRTWPSAAAAVDALIETIELWLGEAGVPRRLSALGVTAGQIPQLVVDSRGNSMNGNPREVSDSELTDLLEHLL